VLQHRLGDRLRVAAVDGEKQQELEQLVVGQRRRTRLAQPAAQPLAMAVIVGAVLSRADEWCRRLGEAAAVEGEQPAASRSAPTGTVALEQLAVGKGVALDRERALGTGRNQGQPGLTQRRLDPLPLHAVSHTMVFLS
jgi:hypothetical protein